MVFLSIGSVRSIQFDCSDGGSRTVKYRSIPLFLPFAFVFFVFQNYRILLSPMKLPKVVVAKVCLKTISQFRFRPSSVALYKVFFIHCLLIPRKLNNPVRLQESYSKHKMWTSRNALVQGFYGGKFSSALEEELKAEFATRTIQMWGQFASNLSSPKIEILGIKSELSLEELPRSDLYVPKQLNFITVPSATVINGSYVVTSREYLNNLPYEVERTNSYPNRDVIILDGRYFRQNYELVSANKDGLFLGSSSNWYHFMIEILPRGIFWHQSNSRSLSVVFNRDTPENILRIISKIGRAAPWLVSDGESIMLGNLTVAADGRYKNQADMHRIGKGNNIFLDRISDLELVRTWMKQNFIGERTKSPSMVFLIRGPGKSRPLRNISEVQLALATLGFVAINPEVMSIEEQINLFENVEFMVAEGGASLTNLIFAKKMRLLIHIEANPHPQVSGFWQQFADSLGVPAVALLGTKNSQLFEPSESYLVDVSDLINILGSFKP